MSFTARAVPLHVMALFTLVGCSDPASTPGGFGGSTGVGGGGWSMGGSGVVVGSGGSSIVIPPAGGGPATGSGGADCSPPTGLLPDFAPMTHADFEYQVLTEKGIVGAMLDPSKKPVFVGGKS